MEIDFLPLKTNANIHEGNALRMDWKEILEPSENVLLFGNPPFLGYSLQSKEQKADMLSVYVDEKGKPYSHAGKIDYVSGWYFKAAEYMQGTNIKTAFVSTNSITQGEQVADIWKPLYDRFHIHIDFAYRTFIWDSESNNKAHVHCVIIGFSCKDTLENRFIYSNGTRKIVTNISPYLIESNNIFLTSRKQPLCHVSSIVNGNKPVDGGHLLLSENEANALMQKEPLASKYVRPIYGSDEFINSKKRYCLWLQNMNPSELNKLPLIKGRVQLTKEFRLASTKETTRRSAEYPYLFQQIRQNESPFILIPRVSSQKRKYIPMGFLDGRTRITDSAQMVPDATLYEFGVLESNVHMAWMRTVAGRLKSDYRYSASIVYNTFPWPKPSNKQKLLIHQTAQMILGARALYPGSSLADLYDPLLMPPELRKAHIENEKAVMEATGIP